jgi:Trk K+ transport system NAD-binding subunit
VEAIQSRVASHLTEQRRVVLADASDPDFWYRVKLKDVELIMLALTNHAENMLVAELLQSLNYQGELAAVVRHADHAEEMQALGVSAFNLYGQAGAGFAAHACDLMEPSPENAA